MARRPLRATACWAAAALTLPGLPSWAQAPQAPAPAASSAAPTQRVEVRADSAAQRRADTAGRQVVPRDELLRHGDTRLADALARVPGVSVEGRGQGVELKLSGLGQGYTQVLLNGEPLPRGVSLDQIALDTLERVEITRGSSVQTAQAVAGTLNLVTRRPTVLASRELKLQAASQRGRPQAQLTLNLGDTTGRATWGLGLTASLDDLAWRATVVQERFEGDPETATQRTRTAKREHDRTEALSLNPRWAWKHEQDGQQWQVSTDHSLRYASSRGGAADLREPELGPAPAQQASDMALNYRRVFWRGRLQLQHRGADGARSEARLNATHASRDQQSRLLGRDFNGQLVQDSAVDGLARDQSVVLNLNHQRPLGDAHRLDTGVEWEQARRREDRVQVQQSLPGAPPPENFDERFDAHVRRQALYLQDDWALAAGTALQLGLRVEQLQTRSEGNVFDGVRQSHELVGPVWRVSHTLGPKQGTVKLGLSRGFRLPTPRDVTPRRYVPVEVSPTAPAQAGNPALRPERAWSLDGSWMGPLPPLAAEVVLSGSLRRIDDVILDRLVQQPAVQSAPWLLQRFNGTRAWSAGLELELRGQLATAWAPTAPLRWQLALQFNRSRLDGVAGPRPALAGQAPWQLKLGLSQNLAPGWQAQIGLDARGAAVADQPSGRRIEQAPRRQMNAGLSWQPRPRWTARLSATSLAARSDVDLKSVQVQEGGQPVRYLARETWHPAPTWRLGLDVGF